MLVVKFDAENFVAKMTVCKVTKLCVLTYVSDNIFTIILTSQIFLLGIV